MQPETRSVNCVLMSGLRRGKIRLTFVTGRKLRHGGNPVLRPCGHVRQNWSYINGHWSFVIESSKSQVVK